MPDFKTLKKAIKEHMDAKDFLVMCREFAPYVNQTHYGQLLIHIATRAENLPAIQCLIDVGADINAVENVGSTPLDCAVSRGDLVAVKFLCKSRADVNHNMQNPITGELSHRALNTAAMLGLVDIGAFLIEQGALMHESPKPLHDAMLEEKPAFVRLLCERGAHPDKNDLDVMVKKEKLSLSDKEICGILMAYMSDVDIAAWLRTKDTMENNNSPVKTTIAQFFDIMKKRMQVLGSRAPSIFLSMPAARQKLPPIELMRQSIKSVFLPEESNYTEFLAARYLHLTNLKLQRHSNFTSSVLNTQRVTQNELTEAYHQQECARFFKPLGDKQYPENDTGHEFFHASIQYGEHLSIFLHTGCLESERCQPIYAFKIKHLSQLTPNQAEELIGLADCYAKNMTYAGYVLIETKQIHITLREEEAQTFLVRLSEILPNVDNVLLPTVGSSSDSHYTIGSA